MSSVDAPPVDLYSVEDRCRYATDEVLLDTALQVYSRACEHQIECLHVAAHAYRAELLRRLASSPSAKPRTLT